MTEREKQWQKYYYTELVRRVDELDKEEHVGLLTLVAVVLGIIAAILFWGTADTNVGCKIAGIICGFLAFMVGVQAFIPGMAHYDMVEDELRAEKSSYMRNCKLS